MTFCFVIINCQRISWLKLRISYGYLVKFTSIIFQTKNIEVLCLSLLICSLIRLLKQYLNIKISIGKITEAGY